jgi:diguanylate cyclase (GGDEF)-like protein
MDALTAAFALLIAQCCVALIMTGAHFAARPERCTGYWASASILVVVGVLAIVLGGVPARPLLQRAGNSCLVLGTILHLWGIRVFYKAPRGNAGWVAGAGFFLFFSALLFSGAPIFQRILLLSTTLLVLQLLSCRALLAGIAARWSFGSVLTLGAISLLMLNNIVRIAAALQHDAGFLPMTRSSTGVVILYLVPLGGIFLYTTGLLLLYFERVVETKNHLATHDDLTGMLNRRAIVSGGEREVAVAIRNRHPLTVAFVDIDFFKRSNDRLGHDVGDRVLADIARLLGDVCRSVDLIGRYGGEEFCLVFPGADRDCAGVLGPRLLAAVREYRFDGQHPVTVSVGFASLPDASGDRTWSNLIHRADMALYQAKASGRDQFHVAAQTVASAADAPMPRPVDA